MIELEHRGYYPLTMESLVHNAPSRAGVYMLAVRLANGVHQIFFTSHTENVYRSIRQLIEMDPAKTPHTVTEHMNKYQCYYTYFAIPDERYRQEIAKLLDQTSDPVVKLQVLNSN